MKAFDFFRHPEMLLSDVFTEAAREKVHEHVLQRAVVLAVDLEGGKLENPNGQGSIAVENGTIAATIGPLNPRGSIKARMLTHGQDRLRSDDDLAVFWPLFSVDQFAMPISPGEHVYVMWEGVGTEHGVWVSRISGNDSANVSIGADNYRAPSRGQQSAMDMFEEPQDTYQKDEKSASRAPSSSVMVLFSGGDDVP